MPQATIAALAQGSWIDDRESVILLGDSGTGKTHLAIALGVLACQQGRRVRFTTLAALANELQEAESRRELSRVVARYVRTELVVLDELGYLALPAGAAELVFQVISERNERASMIVTTNLPFGEWTKVFPDARLAKAVVDRLTHRAHIIDTGSESWRFRHGLARTKQKEPPDPHQRRAGGISAPLRPTGSAPRDAAATPNQRRSTTHTNRRGWSHFRRPRRGHCKRPRRPDSMPLQIVAQPSRECGASLPGVVRACRDGVPHTPDHLQLLVRCPHLPEEVGVGSLASGDHDASLARRGGILHVVCF